VAGSRIYSKQHGSHASGVRISKTLTFFYALSFALAVKATEVYVCGWEGSEYACRLISEQEKTKENSEIDIFEPFQPVKIELPDTDEIEEYFD
jgi:hypothetical protein